MLCDVCERTIPDFIQKSYGRISWVCDWCYAGVSEDLDYECYRDSYESVTDRRMGSGMRFDDCPTVHLGAHTGILCGKSGIDSYNTLWYPDLQSTCQACLKQAHVIDARWPLERRAPTYRPSIARIRRNLSPETKAPAWDPWDSDQ